MKMKVGNPPNQCKPKQVIDGETYVIWLQEEDNLIRSRDPSKCPEIETKKENMMTAFFW